MPFIRVTRDKRGYESTLVMHAYRPGGGGQRGRVLYFFRSPTNIQVGRRALDAEVMEALEHTHPDLSFDWTTLLRDPALRAGAPAEEPRYTPRRQPSPRPTAAPPAPTVVVVEDHTVLGEAVGAERAARLRAAFSDLLQRVARRARTPEDRDRLTERAGRLNPDGWADAAAVQAGVATVEDDWQAIAAELPRRRRGRRGGRQNRDGQDRAGAPAARAAVSSGEVAGPSGIMNESGVEDAIEEHDDVDRENDRDGDRGDDDRFGPEPVDSEADGPRRRRTRRASRRSSGRRLISSVPTSSRAIRRGSSSPTCARRNSKSTRTASCRSCPTSTRSLAAVRARRRPSSATPVASEGLILPRSVPPTDASGRIFIIFIDDLHLLPGLTPKTKNVLEQIRDTLVKDNDLVGFVSSGYSSIATDIQYDYHHQRFNEAIKKTMGGGQTPDELIKAPDSDQGPAGVRYMAQVAFSTANDILQKAEKINNRRKSFIYVSSGYDFDPFKDSRLKYQQDLYSIPEKNADGTPQTTQSTAAPNSDLTDPFGKQGSQFAETDLVAELAELIREANRANVTFYTVDPRGLESMPDIGDTLTYEEWHDNLLETTNSLRVLGDQTGGFCICMTNDYKKPLARIDAETSDYYMIGYNSSNPDPLKYVRKIQIKITRPGVSAENYRTEYALKRPGRKDK